jgi:hypothetical protein
MVTLNNGAGGTFQAINGATGSSYTVQEGDESFQIEVKTRRFSSSMAPSSVVGRSRTTVRSRLPGSIRYSLPDANLDTRLPALNKFVGR